MFGRILFLLFCLTSVALKAEQGSLNKAVDQGKTVTSAKAAEQIKSARQEGIIHQASSFAILGTAKYRADFKHFDYVNPDAPNGGKVIQYAIGSYDNFNRFAMRGAAAARADQLWDSLFTSSADEVNSLYPLIALSARYPENMRWVEVEMNPKARFHDGTPITSTDVVFTLEKFKTEGVPQFRSIFKEAKAIALSPYRVRFQLAQPNRDEMFYLLGGLPIFPHTAPFNLSEPLPTPPLGGGPYRVSSYKTGQYVIYSRVKDYWAADLPVNRGRNNFDTLRYDYYQDDNVALEAFRAGAYDIRTESLPKKWFTQYQGKNFDQGYIIKQEIANQAALSTNWISFNTTRPFFADRRVRLAITLAMDFDWMNKAFNYNSYTRSRSYFQNTPYEATTLPDSTELRWLTPLKGTIPDEVFNQVYQPPVTSGNGNSRENLLQAMQLLKEAGWQVKKQKLINSKTGKPFRFELLLLSGQEYPYALPFKQNLARLGIEMSFRSVDLLQMTKRLRSRDFDMIPRTYDGTPYPSSSMAVSWGTAYLNSSWNTPGVQNKAVDSLLADISHQQTDPKALLALGRALDRILTWNYYNLPLGYIPSTRLAWWNKFSMPATRPTYSLGVDTWWFDSQKAAQLPDQRR